MGSARRATAAAVPSRRARADLVQCNANGGDQCSGRLAPMADAVLEIHRQFRGGTGEIIDEEMRVVTDPTAAGGHVDDPSTPVCRSDQWRRIVRPTEEH